VEEYITIGDPTKNLYEISENHFIKFTHHLLRNYHIEGSDALLQNPIAKKIKILY
jgi:hypothetical protein